MHWKSADKIFRIISGPLPAPPTAKDRAAYERAMDAFFKAIDGADPDQELEVAHEAFKVSPYCTASFCIFADHLANNAGKSLSLLRWGVRVGETYFGPEFFREERGNFHGIVGTRPYMRARFRVAMMLRHLGCYEESLHHLEELVALDHGDHLGARLILMTAYLELGHFLDCKRLLDRHMDDSGPYGLYSQVYWRYATGARKETRLASVANAIAYNPHVLRLMENPGTEIRHSPWGVSWSDSDGAAEYLSIAENLWNRQNPIRKQVISDAKKLPGNGL